MHLFVSLPIRNIQIWVLILGWRCCCSCSSHIAVKLSPLWWRFLSTSFLNVPRLEIHRSALAFCIFFFLFKHLWVWVYCPNSPDIFIKNCLFWRLPARQAVSTLLAQMEAVLELHSSSAVLEAAARTFLSLCGEEGSGGSVVQAAKDALVQKWVDKLTSLLGDSLKVKAAVKLLV